MRDLGRISLTVNAGRQPPVVTNSGTPPVVRSPQDQQSFADRIAVTLARVLGAGERQSKTLRYNRFIQEKQAPKLAEREAKRLDRISSRVETIGSVAQFARRPSLTGATELLKSEGVQKALASRPLAKFAPTITKAVAAAGVFAAVFAAAVAVGATVAAFMLAKRTLTNFAESIKDYSAKVTAAQARADYMRQSALIRAGMGTSGTAAARLTLEQGRFDAAMTRLMSALAPLLQTVVVPVMRVLTKVLTYLAAIAQAIATTMGNLSGFLADFYSIAGTIMMPFNPLAGVIAWEMSEEFEEMNKTLKEIKKNTNPDMDIDYAEANAPFIADLALMGVTDYSKARLP